MTTGPEPKDGAGDREPKLSSTSATSSDTADVAGPVFLPGDLAAGRFRIRRFLARGGMGEVYEAEDLELQETVALKTVRPELVAEAAAGERFRREIHLAHRITHPNVCRIFDVFHHPTPPGQTGREIVFLTMEMLEGETLSQRLRRAGPLAPAEALPLVQQMTAGLAAVHGAGIVHRDFKPDNVVLVSSEGGTRAVVTDFGLARPLPSLDLSTASVTGAGTVLGTPAYMAPEQLAGQEATAASDVYALGLVLYEMVTGAQPFAAETPWLSAMKRLQERPPSPRAHVPELDQGWEATILRCLEREPGRRFAAAPDVARSLSAPPVAAARARRFPSRRIAALGLGGLAVAALAAGTLLFRTTGSHAPPGGARRSLAVLGFKNLSGDARAAWLSTALGEMLLTEMSSGGQLLAVPGENVARMKMDLALADADAFAKDTLARIRRHLGSDLVLLGSYVALGEGAEARIRVDLRLQDAAAGGTIASVAESGRQADLFTLVARAGGRLREQIGIGGTARPEGTRAALPVSPEAARLYSEGLAHLRQLEARTASEVLEKATAADPGHALAHAALAEAWSRLGYDERARAAAREAFERSTDLPPESRLFIEARYREANVEWDPAITTYRALRELAPDNVDYGLRLARTQIRAGRARDALAVLDALRRVTKVASSDGRIDLVEAQALRSLAEHERSQAAAAKASDKARVAGARLLRAESRLLEAQALTALGRLPQATTAQEEARRLFAEAGDRGGEARTLVAAGRVLQGRGDFAGARKELGEALSVFREIGDEAGTARALNVLGTTFKNQARFAEARRSYEEALALARRAGSRQVAGSVLLNLGVLFWEERKIAEARRRYEDSLRLAREVGDRELMGLALNNLAVLMQEEGDPAAAGNRYREAAEVFQQIGDRGHEALALGNVAGVVAEQGKFPEARPLHERALAIYREIADRSGEALMLDDMASSALDRGDLAEARSRQEEALRLRRANAEKRTVPDSLLGLATVALEEGRAEEAEAQAASALEGFRAQRVPDKEARSLVVIARARLAQGRVTSAGQACAQASALAGRSESRHLRLSVTIACTRLGTDASTARTRRQRLETALEEAGRKGLVELQLEARLGLAQIELSVGDPERGRALLDALELESKAKGFGLLARKAAERRPTSTRNPPSP